MKKILIMIVVLSTTIKGYSQVDESMEEESVLERVDKERAPFSTFSSWSGATAVSYNFFEDDDIGNLIGAANIKLGEFQTNSSGEKFNMNLIGTISDIQETASEEVQKNIAFIAQSNQGFQLGIQPRYRVGNEDKFGEKSSSFSFIATVSFKYNSFKDSTNLDEIETINLPQGRLGAGFEFEGLPLIGGNKIYIGIEGFVNVLEAKSYEQVFNEEKATIVGANVGIILPISGVFGFQITTTYVQGFKPIWSAGIILAKLKEGE